jgi:hypothetical protein
MAAERLKEASGRFFDGELRGVMVEVMSAARTGREKDAVELFHQAEAIRAGSMKVESLLTAIDNIYLGLGFDPLPLEALGLPREIMPDPVSTPVDHTQDSSREPEQAATKVDPITPAQKPAVDGNNGSEPERGKIQGSKDILKREYPDKKDRISAAQRKYLEVVYAVNDLGKQVYPNRDLAIQAIYHEEYEAAVESGNEINMIKVYGRIFNRVGNNIREMLENALSRNQGPQELLDFIVSRRNLEPFKDLSDHAFVMKSQR